ncbi:hypothetical protein, partial [Streptosporangium lutulentum]
MTPPVPRPITNLAAGCISAAGSVICTYGGVRLPVGADQGGGGAEPVRVAGHGVRLPRGKELFQRQRLVCLRDLIQSGPP